MEQLTRERKLAHEWVKEYNELQIKAMTLLYNMMSHDPDKVRGLLLSVEYRNFEAAVAQSKKCDAIMEEWNFEVKKEMEAECD